MMDDQDKIEMILEWAKTRDYFDTCYVEKLQGQMNKYGILTERQTEALDNIIDKFGIE